ncbi:MAG TPA: helix-turn-helix domain-containing protein [Iamia sp.]
MTDSRATPQQRRSAEKVAAIVGAARSVLVDGGELTTAVLARRAGVAIGTVYRYFADVDAVLEAVLVEHAEAATAAVDAALDALPPDADARTAFHAVLDAHLALYRRRPELTAILSDPALAARHRGIEAVSDGAMAAVLAARFDADLVRLTAAWRSVGAVLGTSLHARPADRPALEADLRALVDHHAARLRGHAP